MLDAPEMIHPNFHARAENYEKWRLTYEGGTRFIRRYLKKFSIREDDQSFNDRRSVSYCPAFAKAAVEEVKNSIFQRLADITRDGGPQSYTDAVEGRFGGVDRRGSSMMSFMGRDILPELLTMAQVGIFIDRPPVNGIETLADRDQKNRPYLYWYRAEDIRAWAFRDDDPAELRAILLRDHGYTCDDAWDLPSSLNERYRYVFIGDDGKVHVQFHEKTEPTITKSSPNYSQVGDEIVLELTKIPFVLLSLSDSLLADVADYQVTLLNLASSDISYVLKSNYPFYTEQFDWKAEAPYMKPPGPGGQVATTQTDTSFATIQEKTREVKIGSTTGRRYPSGMDRPGFIHPSSEPLRASMDKQTQLKEEIRQLVHLAVATLSATRQSADSQRNDQQGLEAGLSYIGLELEHAERKIAEFWAAYEGDEAPAAVFYPTQYSLLSDAERRVAAQQLRELLPVVPSLTFRREVSKRIADIVLGTKVRGDVLRQIKGEIDADPVVIGDPDVIEQDVASGLVDLETASAARGYPSGVVAKAKQDHAERLARILESQTAQARGVADLGVDSYAGKNEKTASQEDQTFRDQVKQRTRGEET